ncbi:MAG: helix-turn-helix domain-containing protein [Halobaculum sp.]
MPATAGITRQDVLLLFDRSDDPLTTREVADAFDVTPEGARYHLNRMAEDGDLRRKEVGAGYVWFAEVAPELSERAAREVDDRTETDEFVSLDG